MITIERARVEDVDPIKRVLGETWAATYADCLSRSTIELVTTHWHHPDLLRSQIEEPSGFFAVAKEDGRIVGLITAVATSGETLHLPRLYVHPAYQGCGIGTRLLNAAIAAYPEATLIRLAVEEHNAKGHAYWRGQGFVDTGKGIEEVGTDRVSVIAMERRIK